jgi:hypothetical protein
VAKFGIATQATQNGLQHTPFRAWKHSFTQQEFAIPLDFIQSVQPYIQITFLVHLRPSNPGK